MSFTSTEYLANFLKQRKRKAVENHDIESMPNEVIPFKKNSNYSEFHFEHEIEALSHHPIENIKIHLVSQTETFVHEIAMAASFDENILKPMGEYLVDYPFKLDPFQERAVKCIHNKHSIIVSAHTSAGKTVVAEYGIAQALHCRQRLIYTTPIKALSNQKYHDFVKRYGFEKVGLVTGDVTTNPDADIVVMTAEILRLMIYRGSPVTHEVGWVVFDEIHYMRDLTRGYVWEEIISLLPAQVRLICLSATIPNAAQLAQWIVYLHSDNKSDKDTDGLCHVISTEYRPVPLEHYLCNSVPLNDPSSSCPPEFKLVVDNQGRFHRDAYKDLMKEVEKTQSLDIQSTRQNDECESLFKVVKFLLDDKREPILVFTFSKAKAESIAKVFKKKLKITSKLQRKQIKRAYLHLLGGTLSETDAELPQIGEMLSLLRCGIAFHHSGLLPAVKEAIEILFANNALSVVVATETFAMGLNMPARSVIFADLQKHDGRSFRWLTPSEYIQMSGRSGRRGTDTLGTVIVMVKPDKSRIGSGKSVGLLSSGQALQEMLTSKSEPIRSAFRLTYHTILNFMRIPDTNVLHLMHRSLFHIQSIQEKIPLTKKICSFLQSEIEKLPQLNEIQQKPVEEYISAMSMYSHCRNQIWSALFQVKDSRKLFTPGRFLETKKYGWTVLLKVEWSTFSVSNGTKAVLSCLVPFVTLVNEINDEQIAEALNKDCIAMPFPEGLQEGVECFVWRKITVSESAIVAVSQLSMADDKKKLSKWLVSPSSVSFSVSKWNQLILEAKHRQENMDPALAFSKVTSNDHIEALIKSREKHRQEVESHIQFSDGQLSPMFVQNIFIVLQRRQLQKFSDKHLKLLKQIVQRQDLSTRITLLKQLNYCDNRELLTLKGRVACEINATDESDSIVLTELLLEQFFHSLTMEECVAVLSCFTMEHRFAGNDSVAASEMDAPSTKKQHSHEDLLSRLNQLFFQLKDKAKDVQKVVNECEVTSTSHNAVGHARNYVERLQSTMMWPSYQWARGKSFKFCTFRNPELAEGSVVRAIRSLHELLQHMQKAALVISSHELADKFTEAGRAIYRDTVFCKSLWSILVEPKQPIKES